MNRINLAILTSPLIICLISPVITFAETIVLKSGNTIESKIIEKTDKYIKIDFLGVPLTYYSDEIESINGEKLTESSKGVVQSQGSKNVEAKKYAEKQNSSIQASPQAKQYSQKEGLFKVDVPGGWRWNEEPGLVLIMPPPPNSAGIVIKFVKIFQPETQEEIKARLRSNIEGIIYSKVTGNGNALIDNQEITMGSAYACRLRYSILLQKTVFYFTHLTFINKDHEYTIDFGNPSKEEVAKMEKIAYTLKF